METSRFIDFPCAAASIDDSGAICFANARLGAWLGLGHSSLVGRPLRALMSNESAVRWLGVWLPDLEDGREVEDARCELIHASGEAIPFTIAARRAERDGRHEIDVALMQARGRAMQEAELASSQAELRLLVHEATRVELDANDRALFAEQMVGIVSHDLRNPLAAIQMGALALSKGELSTYQTRVVGRITRSAERAHRLISDLLDFTAARLGRGLAISPRPIDLHEAIDDAVEELALAFPGRTIQAIHEGEARCEADPDRIAQLVGNLVANAMAYGDPAKAVTVSTSSGLRSSVVAVHNWGPPIDPGAMDELFKPMVRGASVGAVRSVGLGLYIVEEIAKAHGGAVSARSSEAEGTTFLARLPAGEAVR